MTDKKNANTFANAIIRICNWINVLLPAPGAAVLGYVTGQYYPLFSSFMTQHWCKPYSMCRNDAAITYAVVGGIAGLVLSLYVHSKQVDTKPW